jgi:hypothetical protein
MNKEFLEKLREALPNLLTQWSPRDNVADYQCAFCYKRPKDNMSEIDHWPNCIGIELLKELNK